MLGCLLKCGVSILQLVTSATGNQQVNSNDLNSLIQGVRLTQASPSSCLHMPYLTICTRALAAHRKVKWSQSCPAVCDIALVLLCLDAHHAPKFMQAASFTEVRHMACRP